MLKKLISNYKESFSGLSSDIWWLSLITFINRAGTMVLPFLSLYLTDYLNFSLSNVGWIMSVYGLGSLAGSWLGGKLTDKFGFYKVMVWSLFLTGLCFIGLQFASTFIEFSIGILLTMTIADTFRPAMFVSLKAYSKPENQTRSLTLIRLAINLGFSFGPFLGGLIISLISYRGLFWIDGLTCISAIIIFKTVLKEKEISEPEIGEATLTAFQKNKTRSLYNDKPYWIFLAIMFIMGLVFLQLFTTMPLFYKEVHGLTEIEIGLLMSLNGLIIFFLEMPVIHYIEKSFWNKIKLILFSMVLFSISFFVLPIDWIGILVIGMIFITIAEMLAFPFTNTFAMSRAIKGKEGQYMALYAMSFSVAHIFSAKIGMEMIEKYGYNSNWFLMGALSLVGALLCVWLLKALKQHP
ncbi:MAG: MFS transporter [Flavobacteriaceae bacterium]|nr:MFS transporter [Flavobacteriaceae bacterium]